MRGQNDKGKTLLTLLILFVPIALLITFGRTDPCVNTGQIQSVYPPGGDPEAEPHCEDQIQLTSDGIDTTDVGAHDITAPGGVTQEDVNEGTQGGSFISQTQLDPTLPTPNTDGPVSASGSSGGYE